jgi:hypothetical protein
MFESQEAIITKYGPGDANMLPISRVLQIILELISNGPAFFGHHDDQTHFRLELHFRCVCAALRLVCAQGLGPGSGSLSVSTFENLYNHMSWWRNFHLDQVNFDKRRDKHKKALNYDNEFLIVYVRDLIATIPIERTMVANVTRRMTSTAAAAVHLVAFRIHDDNLTCVVREKSVTGGKIA